GGKAGGFISVFTDGSVDFMLRGFSSLKGDDMNYTGESVRAVNRRLRTANNFDAFNGIDVDIAHVKSTATAIGGVIKLHAIEQYQGVVTFCSAQRNGCQSARAALLFNPDTWHLTQGIH